MGAPIGIVWAKDEAKEITPVSKQNLVFLVLSGIETGLSWLFYFEALQLGEVSKVVAVDKLSVPFAILLSIIFLKETMSFREVVGVVLILTGVLVLAMK